MQKIKPCKLCEKKRYANLSWCYQHYREREKLKKEETKSKKLARKLASKGFQESERKRLHKQAWKLMSEYIRRKNANLDGYVYCYTCGNVMHWTQANAGHFKHDRLDFDERNLKEQCVACNLHNSGRLDVYAERLIEENGLEWFKQLCRDANEYNKYDVERLKSIIIDLTNKLKTMSNFYKSECCSAQVSDIHLSSGTGICQNCGARCNLVSETDNQ